LSIRTTHSVNVSVVSMYPMPHWKNRHAAVVI
jgi:hypothetical protein